MIDFVGAVKAAWRPSTVALVFLLAVGMGNEAGAQSTLTWSDLDCGQSKLVVPAGLRCRDTNDIMTKGLSNSGGGLSKRWNAFGAVKNVRYYYYVHEEVTSRAHLQVGQFASELRSFSPEAKHSTNMSELMSRSGADFVTFVGAKGESCVGIRKLGPSVSTGVAWALWASRCVPAGKTASEADIDAFITAADFRH